MKEFFKQEKVKMGLRIILYVGVALFYGLVIDNWWLGVYFSCFILPMCFGDFSRLNKKEKEERKDEKIE